MFDLRRRSGRRRFQLWRAQLSMLAEICTRVNIVNQCVLLFCARDYVLLWICPWEKSTKKTETLEMVGLWWHTRISIILSPIKMSELLAFESASYTLQGISKLTTSIINVDKYPVPWLFFLVVSQISATICTERLTPVETSCEDSLCVIVLRI